MTYACEGVEDDVDVATWLVEHRRRLDGAEALWLERLAEFDRDGLWALDGHLSAASWLMWKTQMARSTAFEKLRVAHELARRPVVAAAFADGRLSYSAVRALTRMVDPDPDVDEALVELATSGVSTIVDIERLVRSYLLYADQDRPPTDDPLRRRDVRIRRGDGDGTGQIVITLSDLEVEEFAAALQAFIDRRYRPRPVEQSSAEDSPSATHGVVSGPAGAVEESSAGDCGNGFFEEAPLEEANRAARKADALMDLVHVGLAGADDGFAAGDDRYLVHLVTRDHGHSLTTLDGTPIDPADASAITCDCAAVSHLVADDGEPLSLGRKTREWNTAQRRAISVRDGGHCRFPGCQHRIYDIHHLQPWEHGGPTDVHNGTCECRRHHKMLHQGYTVQGDPNGELRFYRPDGGYIGATYPAAARTLCLGGV